MKNRLVNGSFATIIQVFVASLAFAVMPPEHYKRLAEESEIKATAEIVSVNTIQRTKRSIYKEVTF